MATAYVLINCDLGYEEQIIEGLRHISDVKEVHGTFGVYDILATVESDAVKKLDSHLGDSQNTKNSFHINTNGHRRSGLRKINIVVQKHTLVYFSLVISYLNVDTLQ